jgi:hypothetical protein
MVFRTRQITVKRTRGSTAVSAYAEVTRLAGAAVLESRKARYRTSWCGSTDYRRAGAGYRSTMRLSSAHRSLGG